MKYGMADVPAIGVVFDIDGLSSGSYGYSAWRLFMRRLDPQRIKPCLLSEGDTLLTLNGRANEFCIALYGLPDLDYVRETFESLDDPGLAPFHRRFIEQPALDEQPLGPRGRLDAWGSLVTESWTRVDHDLCQAAGWAYAPRSVPPDLDADLLRELAGLNRPRLG